MKRGYDRRDRVADLIQKSLAQILLQDSVDEHFRLLTITGVTISRDLSYAKVYFSTLEDDADKIKLIGDALNQSAKTFRYQLAHAVDLRIVPELKFVYDDSTARGFRISSLIDSTTKKNQTTKKSKKSTKSKHD